jgi:hypothetical protein
LPAGGFQVLTVGVLYLVDRDGDPQLRPGDVQRNAFGPFGSDLGYGDAWTAAERMEQLPFRVGAASLTTTTDPGAIARSTDSMVGSVIVDTAHTPQVASGGHRPGRW